VGGCNWPHLGKIRLAHRGVLFLDELSEISLKVLEVLCQEQLTTWAYHRVLKLSRTITDLAGSEGITQVHLAEAFQYRPKLDLM